MNEGDFDKKISEKLRDDHTNYPDMDKNWQKVVKKMAENPPSKPTAGGVIVLPNTNNGQKPSLVPWLLAGMLLLLGSNGWLFWRLLEANNSPKTMISGSTTSLPQTIRLYDTIIETKVIYKIDTIYKKVVVNETYSAQNNNVLFPKESNNNKIITSIPPSVFSPNSDVKRMQTDKLIGQNTNKNTTYEPVTKPTLDATKTITRQTTDTNTNDKTTTKPTLEATKTTTRQQIGINTSDKTTAISPTFKNNSTDSNDGTNHNHISILTDSVQSHTNTDSLNDNLRKVVLSKNDSMKVVAVPYDSLEMKPQQGLSENIITKPSRKKLVISHYGIGLQGGTSWEFPKLNGVENGYWVGLTNEIALNKHLRIGVSADYMAFYYKALTRSTLHAIPNNPPMTENYDLKYIESTTPSVLMGLNVSYFLKPKSKINPFVSLQYSHRWIVPHTVEFEFTNKITGDDRSFRVENYTHQDNWFLIGAGIETPLSEKVFGQLKAEYLYDPNHGNSSLKYVVLRGGVFYRF